MLGRLEAGQHQLDVAQAMGVSLTTLKKWLRRYRAEGPAGLLDRSCRPRCSPRQLPAECVAQVIALRQQRRTGRFICQRLQRLRGQCLAHPQTSPTVALAGSGAASPGGAL